LAIRGIQGKKKAAEAAVEILPGEIVVIFIDPTKAVA
jgi:hypothetical protein